MADSSSAAANTAESKGKGKATEPTTDAGMDVDDSSSEEEVDEVSSYAPASMWTRANNLY